MKNFIVLISSLFIALSVFSQASPASFDYKVMKLEERLYEVSIITHINRPWHIYSQFTPSDGPSLPTSIKFGKNPLIEMAGKTEEKGNLITKHDAVLDVNFQYFSDKVEFVQKVKLKADVKTNLTGTIQYMVCTDSQCSKPTTVSFNLDLN